MAEWLYEDGIGEARAALVVDGEILEAGIEPEGGPLRVGTVADARLVEVLVPRLSGRVALDDGGEAILDGIPPGTTQGAAIRIRIVREAIPEAGRPKLAKAVAALPDESPRPGPTLIDRIRANGSPVRILQPHEPDLLEAAGWSELIEEAETGEIAFAGGALRMSVTPAMTLFDVDGGPPVEALAIAGAAAAGRAIRRMGIGGSIGIDLPTLPGRQARRAAAEALDAALPQPFERTAVNGFGFLQIVRRRQRASLPELLAADPVAARLRAALRRAERDVPTGGVLHLARAEHALATARADWIAALARRTGRPVTLAPLQ
ncbi:ribonuclease [Sphingomonas colocasiae]|uniref:Ribonuclease n=1 Tax=Sphingomonas colocasiae TaxID=1848973 RepID=A0ABS7PTG2_9SPHN|nr:ribonuclease [Sphingomonas colocasiae]MBY8824269.1 ribonuclease [Sphingomonas colocasiae]